MLDRRTTVIAFAAVTLLTACMTHNAHPEVYGHRGCRGLLPENTLPAFLHATELGVDFLELDVVMSKDGQVVVSHEPWMDHRICTKPDGSTISEVEERSLNLFQMEVREIQGYGCGDLELLDFPDQEQRRTYKPTLREVVEAADEHAMVSGVPAPSYAIEIKSDTALYGTHQPLPEAFALVVLEMIDSLGIADRCVVQSFDTAILEAVHVERPDMTVSFLVENKDGWKTNLKKLSFQPDIYSPWFGLIDAKDVEQLHALNMQVAVWTVNETADIRKVMGLGIDAIISDYPDRVITLLEDEP